ncbi:replication initiation protein [Clostridium hydrogeniformans]|uniref:replication initiation protein n=1 Tax=Clostridium hydrogeniformans TaxID=349933 RepID=UPI0004833887|nr:replication initiation protein [Clostridium hydrogeniformans]
MIKKVSINRKNKSSNINLPTPEFQSVYGKLLFLYLKRHCRTGNTQVYLEDLKEILMAPKLAHTYSNLRLRVLDRIIVEFDEIDSPLKFQYEILEEGERVLIKFKILGDF